MLSVIIFALVVFFLVSLVYVEAINEGKTSPAGVSFPVIRWWQQYISFYLSVPNGGRIQSTGFIGLSVAEILLAIQHRNLGLPWIILLVLSALALLIVVITAWLEFDGNVNAWVHTIHTKAAGVAFGGTLFAEGIYFWHTPEIWLVWGALISTGAIARFAPEQRVFEEKVLTGWIGAALLLMTGLIL